MHISGFGIGSFFLTCVKELIREGKASELLPYKAITREIEKIQVDFNKKQRSPSTKAILQLLKEFYTDLSEQRFRSFDELEEVAIKVIKKIVEEIEAIKVEEVVST